MENAQNSMDLVYTEADDILKNYILKNFKGDGRFVIPCLFLFL